MSYRPKKDDVCVLISVSKFDEWFGHEEGDIVLVLEDTSMAPYCETEKLSRWAFTHIQLKKIGRL